MLRLLAHDPVLLLDRQILLRADQLEWSKFAPLTPEGRDLNLQFNWPDDPADACLLIDQDDVKRDWRVELNGTRLGLLSAMEAPLRLALSVPARALIRGMNRLSIRGPKETDDILIRKIQILPVSLDHWLHEADLQVEVTDGTSGQPMPARITICTTNEFLAPIATNPSPLLATRTGVVYTGDGHAQIHVPAGDYVLYASRGFEYARLRVPLKIASAGSLTLRLALAHEVDPADWICTDTHIHTLALSHHGDATLEERMVTLAGEGIHFPISTEHNLFSDYQPVLSRLALQHWVTAVPGEEVTTAAGHFNIFPLKPGATLPDARLTNWSALLPAIRATPQISFVILNHPRDLHVGFRPFSAALFDPLTGQHRFEHDLTVDAIEVVNSGAQQSDPMQTYRDWFALLNRGGHFSAVGASDSHDVSRYIVGQGRTYFRYPRSAAPPVDIDRAVQSFKKGALLVSMGLLTLIDVNGHFGPGDLVNPGNQPLQVTVKILGPSWASPDHLDIFADGEKIIDEKLAPNFAPGLKQTFRYSLPPRKRDYYLVAIASGPGITEPFWKFAPPYQPSSTEWEPRCIGSTNPIWIDADGDGQFTSPNGYARQLIAAHAQNPNAFFHELRTADAAVQIQAADLMFASGGISSDFRAALHNAPAQIQAVFQRRGSLTPHQ